MVRGEGKTSNGRTTTRARSRPSPGRFLSAGMYGISSPVLLLAGRGGAPSTKPVCQNRYQVRPEKHRPKETKSRPQKLGIPDTERCIPDGSHWNSPKLEMDGRRSDAKATVTIRFSSSRLICCIQEGDHSRSWGSLGEYTLSKGVWSPVLLPPSDSAFNFLAREAPAQKSVGI